MCGSAFEIAVYNYQYHDLAISVASAASILGILKISRYSLIASRIGPNLGGGIRYTGGVTCVYNARDCTGCTVRPRDKPD